METQLNQLFQAWQQMGAPVLVAQVETKPAVVRSLEDLISESTALCRYSGRLTWIVLDGLLKNKDRISIPVLLKATKKKGDLAVLGVIANAAYEQERSRVFEKIMYEGCMPNPQPDFFFYRVKKSPLASRLTLENPLMIYKNWNFWCNELRYLNQKATS